MHERVLIDNQIAYVARGWDEAGWWKTEDDEGFVFVSDCLGNIVPLAVVGWSELHDCWIVEAPEQSGGLPKVLGVT